MFHLTQPQFQDREVRCALLQAIDRQDFIDVVYGGFGEVASGPFSPGQDGYLDDAGLPEYDPEAAAAAIEAWEAENGPLEINYSTTPTGTTKAIADYLQSAWGEVGVDVTQTADRAVGADHQRPARLAGVLRLRLAQPRRVSSSTPRTTGGTASPPTATAPRPRTASIALELRPAQRPGRSTTCSTRPGRRPTPPPARRSPRRSTGSSPSECWILPTSWTTWGIIMDPERPEHRPQHDARRRGQPPRRRRLPRPGLADRGVRRRVERAACATHCNDWSSSCWSSSW